MRWLHCVTKAKNMNLDKLLELVKDRGPTVLWSIGSQRVGYNLTTQQQQQNFIFISVLKENKLDGSLCEDPNKLFGFCDNVNMDVDIETQAAIQTTC